MAITIADVPAENHSLKRVSAGIAAIVVVCLIAGALLGTTLRAKVPERHLSQDSMDVIKLATGLMATLAAQRRQRAGLIPEAIGT
jgi:hypothetical protein